MVTICADSQPARPADPFALPTVQARLTRFVISQQKAIGAFIDGHTPFALSSFSPAFASSPASAYCSVYCDFPAADLPAPAPAPPPGGDIVILPGNGMHRENIAFLPVISPALFTTVCSACFQGTSVDVTTPYR